MGLESKSHAWADRWRCLLSTVVHERRLSTQTRPVNLTGRLFVLRVMLEWLEKQITRMGELMMVMPVYTVVHEP